MKTYFLSLMALCLMMPFSKLDAQWTTDFEQAKMDATAQQKLILLSFSGSDWCIPCIKMKKTIFESPDFTDYAATQLVLLNADFPRLKKNKLPEKLKKQNERLAEKYNPNGSFPYTLLLTADGKVLKVWEGLPNATPDEFVEALKQTLHTE